MLLFFGLLIARRKELRSPQRLESALSREAAFLFNNWAFMALLAIVFWGTLFPKISDWWTGQEILLGPQFFNKLALVPALFLLFLTGVGPLIAWRRASWSNLRRQFVAPAIAGAVTLVALLAWFRGGIGPIPLSIWTLCAFVLATVVLVALQNFTEGELSDEVPWPTIAFGLGAAILAVALVKSATDAGSSWFSYGFVGLAGAVAVGAYLDWAATRRSERPALARKRRGLRSAA